MGLSQDILEKIHKPIWFNAIGFDDKLNFNRNKMNDFIQFIEYLTDKPNSYFLSVRNDSSHNLMKQYMSSKVMQHIAEVPDGGFFVKPKHFYDHIEINSNLRQIAINPAGDMINVRFGSEAAESEYLAVFAEGLEKLLDEHSDIQIIFVAHHHDDARQINILINKLQDWHRRRRISVAPFIPNWRRAEYIFDLYKSVDLVIGGRFHSNLCAIAQGTPTIGILSYHKHKYIYEHYSMQEQMLEIDKGEISMLNDRIEKYMHKENSDIVRKNNLLLQRKLGIVLAENHKQAEKWLKNFYS